MPELIAAPHLDALEPEDLTAASQVYISALNVTIGRLDTTADIAGGILWREDPTDACIDLIEEWVDERLLDPLFPYRVCFDREGEWARAIKDAAHQHHSAAIEAGRLGMRRLLQMRENVLGGWFGIPWNGFDWAISLPLANSIVPIAQDCQPIIDQSTALYVVVYPPTNGASPTNPTGNDVLATTELFDCILNHPTMVSLIAGKPVFILTWARRRDDAETSPLVSIPIADWRAIWQAAKGNGSRTLPLAGGWIWSAEPVMEHAWLNEIEPGHSIVVEEYETPYGGVLTWDEWSELRAEDYLTEAHNVLEDDDVSRPEFPPAASSSEGLVMLMGLLTLPAGESQIDYGSDIAVRLENLHNLHSGEIIENATVTAQLMSTAHVTVNGVVTETPTQIATATLPHAGAGTYQGFIDAPALTIGSDYIVRVTAVQGSNDGVWQARRDARRRAA